MIGAFDEREFMNEDGRCILAPNQVGAFDVERLFHSINELLKQTDIVISMQCQDKSQSV